MYPPAVSGRSLCPTEKSNRPPALVVIVSALLYSVGTSLLAAWTKAPVKEGKKHSREKGWRKLWWKPWKSVTGGVCLVALLLSGVEATDYPSSRPVSTTSCFFGFTATVAARSPRRHAVPWPAAALAPSTGASSGAGVRRLVGRTGEGGAATRTSASTGSRSRLLTRRSCRLWESRSSRRTSLGSALGGVETAP